MADVTYAIVFSGEIVEGFQIISVKAHLAKMLRATPDKMQVLFSGKPIVLKRTADKAEAAKYGSALKKVGADVRVKIIKTDPTAAAAAPAAKAPSTPPTPPTTAAAAAAAAPLTAVVPDTSNLSLAPNEGNIVEPTPPPPPLELDLSGISVSENDGSPLVEPKAEVKLDIDLSGLSVLDNDGSPLITPKAAVPKVDAPDFSLDEPGAILETIKETVEALNPDTSSMSLAFPGSDLLNPEEKDQGPPPKAPDTSKLSVVENRAVFD
ncbi:MAG: hypothetical protein ACI82A_003009 [Candidatus Azotimanducaceae bacterium]|jgi:hypothetical protein